MPRLGGGGGLFFERLAGGGGGIDLRDVSVVSSGDDEESRDGADGAGGGKLRIGAVFALTGGGRFLTGALRTGVSAAADIGAGGPLEVAAGGGGGGGACERGTDGARCEC